MTKHRRENLSLIVSPYVVKPLLQPRASKRMKLTEAMTGKASSDRMSSIPTGGGVGWGPAPGYTQISWLRKSHGYQV